MCELPNKTNETLRKRLQNLYGPKAVEVLPQIESLIEKYAIADALAASWDQRDAVLITYGDQIRSRDATPLATLHRFLTQGNLHRLINTVHLLPFFPYSSDDGFSVIDYRKVDPKAGDWDDIEALRTDCSLMFDLVLNHVSSQSDWFQSYLAGQVPFTRFFIECDPETDLSNVTRPRSLPLLTAVDTKRGPRHVWTTFSADQVDLNFSDPDVLVEMLDVLLLYASRGARIIRLDAIAYLWKKIGTNCIHLPETHEVVKLMRDVLQATMPQVLILTETNVPHAENVSYFGEGDEAQMVYQFSLPPLLLDAFVHSDPTPLRDWLRDLEPPASGTTYFNFTASHDGIGVRPLEGLVAPERLQSLVEHVRNRGGRVSTKANSDGTDSPYELNITYVDAIAEQEMPTEPHADRFLASQAVMLALQGIPGIYFHSLVGTQNDLVGMELSNHARRINRHKYDLIELEQALNENPLQKRIYEGYQRLLEIRTQQAAFHPDTSQQVIETSHPTLLALMRGFDNDSILCITNFGQESVTLNLTTFTENQFKVDLISETEILDATLSIPPGTTMWLK